MPSKRNPKSIHSWVGSAAHEVGKLTAWGPKLSAAAAWNLADEMLRNGQDLFATDPRSTARATYSDEARDARFQQESDRAAESGFGLVRYGLDYATVARRTYADEAPRAEADRIRRDEEIRLANIRDDDDFDDYVRSLRMQGESATAVA